MSQNYYFSYTFGFGFVKVEIRLVRHPLNFLTKHVTLVEYGDQNHDFGYISGFGYFCFSFAMALVV